MRYLKILCSWLKANKWICFSYVVVAIVLGLFSIVYLDKEIKESHSEIQDEIDYGIFANKKSFGIRHESYTLVSYSKTDVPELLESSDSSSYSQQYGGLNTYFKATGGWTIKVYKKEGSNMIVETSIKPYSVGYKSASNTDPEFFFRRLYNNIISDEDYNIDVNNEFKVSKLTTLETKFHKMSLRNIGIDEGLMWYDFYNGRAFSQLKQERLFSIIEKDSKIDLYRIIYIFISLIISTVLFVIIFRLIHRKKNINKSRFNLDFSINKTSENIKDNPVEVEDLLAKLNPSNFMSPYDPEKVKIANDLYSALLKSQGNENIISMIKDKALSELGIE